MGPLYGVMRANRDWLGECVCVRACTMEEDWKNDSLILLSPSSICSQEWSHTRRCQLLRRPIIFEYGPGCRTELSRSETVRWFDWGADTWRIEWAGEIVQILFLSNTCASLAISLTLFGSFASMHDVTMCNHRWWTRGSHYVISKSKRCSSLMIEPWMRFCLVCRVLRMDRFRRNTQ